MEGNLYSMQYLRLGPVQLLLRDSTCYRNQLPNQYLQLQHDTLMQARVKYLSESLYLCELNQALWV